MCFHKKIIRDFQIHIAFIYKNYNKLENTTRCHMLYIYVKQSIIGIYFHCKCNFNIDHCAFEKKK